MQKRQKVHAKVFWKVCLWFCYDYDVAFLSVLFIHWFIFVHVLGKASSPSFWMLCWGSYLFRHMRPGPSCVLNHIRGRTAVYCNFSSFHKFSHCCIFQTCRTAAVMFCVFDLRYLQLQQNLFMLSIKKCHTLRLACHLLARRRPPTFFISWVGCVDICVSWSIRSRYPIESKRNCIYTTFKKTVRCQELLRTCVFFISCFPVSSMFFEK